MTELEMATEKLQEALQLVNEANTSTYTITYILVNESSLDGWFDPIVGEILEKLDPDNYPAHSEYYHARHHYYDKSRVKLDFYYLTHPYLFQIVQTLGHWALLNRNVELLIIKVPYCRYISAITGGELQYSKVENPREVLQRAEERKRFMDSLLAPEKVKEVIDAQIEMECKRVAHAEFTAEKHLKWSEERTKLISSPTL